MPDDRLQTILKTLKRSLARLYGPRLKGLVLFGSHARGEATSDSDIDIALVLDDFTDVGREIHRYGGLASRLCLRFNVLVAIYPVRESEWRSEQSPILLNIRREGVPV